MEQKCSYMKVLEVFFREPTTIQFIKSISKEINLAHTSVRNHIKTLLKEGMIKKKASRPFDGYVANRDDENFIFQKRAYNLLTLKELKDVFLKISFPKLLVVYGSYSIGEDTETSDIDIFILNKTKRNFDMEKLEKKLKRKIHIMTTDSITKIDASIRKKIQNGIVLHGGF